MRSSSSFTLGTSRWTRWSHGLFADCDGMPFLSPMASTDAEVRVLHNLNPLPHVRERSSAEKLGVAPLDAISFKDALGRIRTLDAILREEFRETKIEVNERVPVVVRGQLAWKTERHWPPRPVQAAFQSHHASGHVALCLGEDGHVSKHEHPTAEVVAMHAIHDEAVPPVARIAIAGCALAGGCSMLVLVPLKGRCPWSDAPLDRERADRVPIVATILSVRAAPPASLDQCAAELEGVLSKCPLVCPASAMHIYGSYSACP